MMKNHGYIILGVIFVFGIFSMVNIFNNINSTGEFTYGRAGMGRYYAGGGWVQFQPVEACEFMGAQSFDPPQLFQSELSKQMMVICYNSDPSDKRDSFAVPLVQWVYAEPVPGQYNPLG